MTRCGGFVKVKGIETVISSVVTNAREAFSTIRQEYSLEDRRRNTASGVRARSGVCKQHAKDIFFQQALLNIKYKRGLTYGA